MRKPTAAVLVALALVGAASIGAFVDTTSDAVTLASDGRESHSAANTTVAGAGGTTIHLTVFRPAQASSSAPVPVVLHGHGWSGSRATSIGEVRYLLDAGYGVVSIDQRGHGESGGAAHVMNPTKEVRDVQNVVDYAADLAWVETEGDDDPVLGAVGGSYGGGYQTMTALHDDRFDALVPEITWNHLPYALAPNGAIKSTWVSLLYTAAIASQTEVADFVHEGFAHGTATNEFPDGSSPGEPDVEGKFLASSPATHFDHGHEIGAPTLLVQGMPDVLFNLNQALWTYDEIQRDGATVKLVTHLGGHIVNTDGTIPGQGGFQAGVQGPSGPSPCGSIENLQLRWFARHLGGNAGDDPSPDVRMALDDGRCVQGATTETLTLQNPREGTEHDLAGPVALAQPSPVASGYAEVGHEQAPETVEQDARAVRFEVLTASENRLLTGVPYLEGEVTVADGGDAILYLSLVVEAPDGSARTLDAQVTPLRHAGPAVEETFGLELGGVATELTPDETLYLAVSTNDPQYAFNQDRTPGAVVLEDLTLKLPIEAS